MAIFEEDNEDDDEKLGKKKTKDNVDPGIRMGGAKGVDKNRVPLEL